MGVFLSNFCILLALIPNLMLPTFCLASSNETSNKISIQIYYESLCPDSQNFVEEQLYPAYQALGNYLQIDFKPFGNAQVSFKGL